MNCGINKLSVLLLAAVLTVSFCSCMPGGKTGAAPRATDFSCCFDAQYKDMNVKGSLTRYSAGTLALDIDEPSSLKGMSMEWDGERVMVKMLGMEFEVDPDLIPQSALGSIIGGALDAAQGQHEGTVQSDGGMTSVGQSPLGEYTLVFDAQTGYIRSLEMPAQDLSARFTEFDTAGT